MALAGPHLVRQATDGSDVTAFHRERDVQVVDLQHDVAAGGAPVGHGLVADSGHRISLL